MTATDASNDRHRQAEAAARRDLATADALVAQRGTEPPRCGDLYALPAGADAGIEWLVASEPEDGMVSLVATDGLPLIGIHDHCLEASPGAGPRILRGAVVTAIPIDRLPVERRVGVVSSLDIDRFWKNLADAGSSDPTRLEASSDPEYRHWIDRRLKPAIAALGELEPSTEAPTSVAGLRKWPPWWALAASVMLAVLATWAVSESGRTPASEGGEVAMTYFAPSLDVTRSAESVVVDWSPTVPGVVLVFRTLAPEVYASHRLDLVDLEAEAEEPAPALWSRDGLRLQGTSEIVVQVPVDVLLGKEVEARLFGLAEPDDSGVPLERWRFRLAEAAR